MPTSPDSYTTNYNLAKYPSGARGIADGDPSLNNNLDLIDAAIKEGADNISANAVDIADHESRISDLEGTGGLVDIASVQSITGAKTFGTVINNGIIQWNLTATQDIQTTGEIIDVPTKPVAIIVPSVASTSIIRMATGSNGQVAVVINRGSYSTTLIDNDASGNLYLAGDFTMNVNSTIMLIYVSAISKWIEITRSDNG